jgi:hypothetical protein
MDPRNERREGEPASSVAVSAASRVAAGYGLLTEDPVVLQATNNTVVWLRPNEVIAKVGTSLDGAENLIREHAVAVALLSKDARIAPPLAGTEPIRDPDTDLIVTLWTRLDHDPELEVAPTDIAMALRRLHDDLARTQSAQPSYTVAVRRARAMLDDDQLMAAQSGEDRATLRAAIDRLLGRIDAHGYVEQPLHGEPHRGNLLATPSGLRWIDLGGVCVGPLEWDLAFLPDEAGSAFPTADPELLGLLRTLTSACVATWCWLRPEIDEMRRHGELHLERVRRAGHIKGG